MDPRIWEYYAPTYWWCKRTWWFWALAGLCSSQPAVHVATASASHRNEWHAPGSTGRGTVPTLPGTPSVPLAACAPCWMWSAIVPCLRNDNRETLSPQPSLSICITLNFMGLSCSFCATNPRSPCFHYPLCLPLIKRITGEVLRWQDNYPMSCFHWNCNQASGRIDHPLSGFQPERHYFTLRLFMYSLLSSGFSV